VYSPLLIDDLGFSQTGVDLIASIGNNGLYLSIFVGLGIEAFGIRAVVLCGGVFIFLGFFYIWLAVNEYISCSIATICIFFFIAQFGVNLYI
jgi:hypothetical protein